MAKITVVALRKGGVGKTTTAQHLGYALTELGQRVLLADLDPQASLTSLFGGPGESGTMADLIDTDGRPQPDKLREIITRTYQTNLHLAPADDRLASADTRVSRNVQGPFAIDDIFRGQRLPYDHIVIDTAPGRSALLTAALVAADSIVIPVQLSPMGFHGFGAIDEMVEEARTLQRRTSEGMRLRLEAVVPTFHSPGEIMSDVFMGELDVMEHPDYEATALPLSEPIPETTSFEKASTPMQHEDGFHARTIFEMPPGGEGSPTDRGQQAYYRLASIVAGVQQNV